MARARRCRALNNALHITLRLWVQVPSPALMAYKCDTCGSIATHWLRYGKYDYKGKTIYHNQRRLENGIWIDPIMKKYWNTFFPEGMTVLWSSKFCCFRHRIKGSIEL